MHIYVIIIALNRFRVSCMFTACLLLSLLLLIVSYPLQECVSVLLLFTSYCYNLCLGICTYCKSVCFTFNNLNCADCIVSQPYCCKTKKKPLSLKQFHWAFLKVLHFVTFMWERLSFWAILQKHRRSQTLVTSRGNFGYYIRQTKSVFLRSVVRNRFQLYQTWTVPICVIVNIYTKMNIVLIVKEKQIKNDLNKCIKSRLFCISC